MFDHEIERFEEFVSKYLQWIILHFTLKEVLERISSEEWKEAASSLVVALLRWGANTVINVPDLSSQRPLHLAAKLDNPTINTHYGAPLDAVNAKGKAFYEGLNTFSTDT